MHSRFRLHFLTTIAVGAFLLAGCLATAAKITPAERPTLGRIAVTSLLGPEFHLRLTGITVFQNKSAPQNVAEWRVDALLEATAIEALKKTGFSDARSLPLADLSAKDVRAAALLAAQKEGMNTLVTIGYIHTENQPFLNPGSYGIYSRGPNTCLFSKSSLQFGGSAISQNGRGVLRSIAPGLMAWRGRRHLMNTHRKKSKRFKRRLLRN
jgi:hypothetical protein